METSFPTKNQQIITLTREISERERKNAHNDYFIFMFLFNLHFPRNIFLFVSLSIFFKRKEKGIFFLFTLPNNLKTFGFYHQMSVIYFSLIRQKKTVMLAVCCSHRSHRRVSLLPFLVLKCEKKIKVCYRNDIHETTDSTDSKDAMLLMVELKLLPYIHTSERAPVRR